MKTDKLDKINKFRLCFSSFMIILLVCIFCLPSNAFAQDSECIPCSSCDRFESWKFMCTSMSQICILQDFPMEFCDNQKELCEQNTDKLTAECRNMCDDNCGDPESIDRSGDKDTCPECEPTPPVCPDGTCATGENCPQDAGSCSDNVCMIPTCEDGCGETPVTNAEDPGQCDETETPACPIPPCTCNADSECVPVQEEICRIDLSFNKDEFCPGDNIAINLEFLEDGAHIDYTTLSAILKKSTGSEIYISDDFTKTETGKYVLYGGIGNTAGERTLEVKAQFGGCNEEESASYTVLSKDAPECEDREDTECSIITAFDKESYCEGDNIIITTEFISNDILADPTYFGVMVDRIGTTVDISDIYKQESEGVYVFEGIAGLGGTRTFYATAYFNDDCHATEIQDFFVYSADECPDDDEEAG